MKEYKEKFLPSSSEQDNVGVFTDKGKCCLYVESGCNIYGVYLTNEEIDRCIAMLKQAKKTMKKGQ